MTTQKRRGCACGCEATEEELLTSLAIRRQRLEREWQERSNQEQERDAELYAKGIARTDCLIQQVQERLAKRLVSEVEQPAA